MALHSLTAFDIHRAPNPVWDQWPAAELAALGFNDTSTSRFGAIDYPWLRTQILTLASELPGGLSRPNLLLAMWAADFEHPSLGPDIPWPVHGPDDPHPIESAMLRRWNVTQQEWENVELVSAEGQTP